MDLDDTGNLQSLAFSLPSYGVKHDPMSEDIIFSSYPIKEQTSFSLRTTLLTSPCFKFTMVRSHSVSALLCISTGNTSSVFLFQV